MVKLNGIEYPLYHGTCEDSAKKLLENGWKPNQIGKGGNVGKTDLLYITNEFDNAMWFANEKGCNTVIALKNIPMDWLIVDPEDAIENTVQKELERSVKTKLPAYLAIHTTITKDHFKKI
jgi:hypothetical protein